MRVDWDIVKNIGTVIGAVTGPLALFLQFRKHLAEQPKFVIAARMEIRFTPRVGKELWVCANATNRGLRKGYVTDFAVELALERPYRTIRFVSESSAPIAVDGGERIAYDGPIPLDFIPAIKEQMLVTLKDTSGRTVRKKFQTIGREALQDKDFTGPSMPPMPPG